MKELSIEEKAARYDEVLAKAKRYYNEYKTRDNILYVEDMEDMFSELKESEDESIRKALISHFAGFRDNVSKEWYGIKVNDIIAWLEKQGEQKSAWSEDDEKFFKTALWHISYSVSNGKTTDDHCDTTDWLKSLKDRVQQQNK